MSWWFVMQRIGAVEADTPEEAAQKAAERRVIRPAPQHTATFEIVSEEDAHRFSIVVGPPVVERLG